MPRPKGKWKNSPHPCAVCSHERRGDIDRLLVTGDGTHGQGRRAIAEKFGLTYSSISNHARRHITEEYRTSHLVGAQASEEALRELSATEGRSVLENYRHNYNVAYGQFLRAIECGDHMASIGYYRAMNEALWKMGRLTQEVAPATAHTQIQNLYLSPDFYAFQRRAVNVLRRHPEALDDWIAEFRAEPLPPLIETHANAA